MIFNLGNKSKNDAGFGLIEIVVVVTVILVLTTIIVPNFPKIKMQIALIETVYRFEQDLRLAQEMSLAGVKYKDLSGVEHEVDGYGVYVDIVGLGDKEYVIYADKSPGNKQYDASDYIVGTINFGDEEPGIKIKEVNNVSSNMASVNFNFSKIETTITQLEPLQNSVEVVFSLIPDPSKTKKVSVNNSGLIEVK